MQMMPVAVLDLAPERAFEGSRRGGGRLGEDIRVGQAAPELVGAELLAVDELLVAEADRERHDFDAVPLDQVVGQVALSVTTRTPMAPLAAAPRSDRRASIVTPFDSLSDGTPMAASGRVGAQPPPSADSGGEQRPEIVELAHSGAAVTKYFGEADRCADDGRPERDPGFDHPSPRAIIHVTNATSPPAASERERVDQPPAVHVPEAAAQHDDREHGRTAVRRRRRPRDPGHRARGRAGTRRDVESVLEAVQDERRARVLQRVERSQREQIDGERHQSERESRHGVRDDRRVTTGERAPLERATTMGRANAMKIAEQGTITKVVSRSPKDSRSRSSLMSRPAASPSRERASS